MHCIPLTIIGGYLGAGKTTLVNQLLSHNQGQRLAIVVNDFGDINIDAGLITHQDAQTINLSNGCVCCTLGHDLTSQLLALKDQNPPPDHILIEASGVALPGAILQAGLAAGLNPEGVWVLVDVEQVLSQVHDRFVGSTVTRQLAEADVIVLNKADLVTDLDLEEIKSQLAPFTSNPRWCTSQHGNLPSNLLLGQLQPADALIKYADIDNTRDALRPAGNHTKHSAHTATFATWSYTSNQAISEDAFRGMIAELPDSIYRGKGYVRLARENGGSDMMLYQQVGTRWSLDALPVKTDTTTGTQLVFIGQPNAIDEAWLQHHLTPVD